MEGNNKKKNKNYYKYHHNYNHHGKQYYQHYYKKKKKNKQNNVISDKNYEIKEQVVITQEIEKPQQVIQEIFQNNNFDELEFVPIKKSNTKKYKKIGIFKYALGIFVIIAIITGVSYSFFNYEEEDTRQADIASGEVYVKIVEQSVDISLTKMYPRTVTEARSRNDNYIDFTVKGKNSSTTNEIKYMINFSNGDAIEGKTRIDPDYLSADLEEKVGNNYVLRKSNMNLTEFNYSDIIPVNTTSEITKEYRVRVWVNENFLLSNFESNASYNGLSYSNFYATLHVEINSVDREKVLKSEEMVRASITNKINATTNACNPTWTDDMETTDDSSDDIVYFSGDNTCVDMNYIWYSGKLWRIIAIYPDGAMKIVTQNNITTIAYNEYNNTSFYTNANNVSYIYQWLNEDFYDTLYNASEFIDTSKLWNISSSNTSDWNDIFNRLSNTTFVSSNVGMINSYEFWNTFRAGEGSLGEKYANGYFSNNGYDFWLFNPANATNIWGNADWYDPYWGLGVRPSIILKPGLEFTGNGTISSPYKIVGDKNVGEAGERINTRLSGEYVKLRQGNNEKVFRIIGIEDRKTKIIDMNNADNGARRKIATSTSATGTIWGSGATTDANTWYTYLNNTYYPNLVNNYGELFDSAMYYYGFSGDDNRLSICANKTSGDIKTCDKTTNRMVLNIGLPRYGEMFAAQQGGDQETADSLWLMNSYDHTYSWLVAPWGDIWAEEPTSEYAARPTVHLKSNVIITSGSGTESDPYVVSLP